MKSLRIALLAATLSVVLSGSARAQFDLAWDQCPGSFGSLENKRIDCSVGESRPLRLVVSFTSPRMIKQFVGIMVFIDVATTNPTMPDWWRLGAGECRDGVIMFPSSGATVRDAAGTTCQNPWQGTELGGGYLWTTGMSGGGTAKLQLALARNEDRALTLNSGTRYVAGVVEIDASGGGSSCSGCEAEMCISVSEVDLCQVLVSNDSSTETIALTRSSGQTIATFNVKNAGANPCGSKVRNRTWGQVKSTYR